MRTSFGLSTMACPSDRTIGVYKIVNVSNGHFYIGSSVRIGRRVWTHLNRLRACSHHCLPLQRAFNKYGEGAFLVTIVQLCSDASCALEVEQSLLDASFRKPYCYNATGGARSPMLCAETQEKARVGRNSNPVFRANSVAQMAKLQHPDMRAKCIEASLASAAFHANSAKQGENLRKLLSKPVIGRHLTTGEATRYASGMDAMRAIGAKTSSLISKMSMQNGIAYGYQWSREHVV